MMLFTVLVLGILTEALMSWRRQLLDKEGHLYEEISDASEKGILR